MVVCNQLYSYDNTVKMTGGGNNIMAFSKQLIHLRNIRGMSQEELAALMDVTRQSVSKWETNQTYPDSEKLIRLSEIFEVSTDYLLKGTETEITYGQYNSQAGVQMSAEVNDILDHVYHMSRIKRMMIGLSLLAVIIFLCISCFLVWK